ncbi:SE1561 family protein [Pradoshia sp.]
MTTPIYNKEDQVRYLKDRLELFIEVLNQMEPETTDVEDIDRLIEMVDSIEEKFQSFKNRPDEEPEA